MKYNRLTTIYTYTWSFKTIEMINKSLKATVSRIWNDLPFVLRSPENSDNLKVKFEPLYSNLSNVISKLDFISFEMSKRIKEVTKKLQTVGAFLNDQLIQDQLAVQAEQYDAIQELNNSFFIEILKKYDLYKKEIEPHKPTVLEAYIILRERAELCKVIIDQCLVVIKATLERHEANQRGIDNENIEKYKLIAKDIEDCYNDFKVNIDKIKSVFDKELKDVIILLNDLSIPIEFDLDDKRLYIGNILEEIRLTYAMVLGINKPNEAFKKLYQKSSTYKMVSFESNKEQNEESTSEVNVNKDPELVSIEK